MSLRRNRNCKPAAVPVHASIATDRLAAVLSAGLCVGAPPATSATSSADASQKRQLASSHATKASRMIRNNDVDGAITNLEAAEKLAEDIMDARSFRHAKRSSRFEPSGDLDVWTYLSNRREAAEFAETASGMFKADQVDKAVENLQLAKHAAKKVKQIQEEDERNGLIYSSDDELLQR